MMSARAAKEIADGVVFLKAKALVEKIMPTIEKNIEEDASKGRMSTAVVFSTVDYSTLIKDSVVLLGELEKVLKPRGYEISISSNIMHVSWLNST